MSRAGCVLSAAFAFALLSRGIAAVAGTAESVQAEVDATPLNPAQILERAFSNQYDVDTTATIELVIRNSSGQERRRLFETASKIIDDRMHSIGRLVHPEHLRGMTILQIESVDRGHDAFIYLPSLRSVRRVTTAQRGDAFFGTDVTYEDLERRRASDYEIVDLESTRLQGEPAFLIRAQPRHSRSYHEVRFWISQADGAILETRYFKRGDDEPFRIVSAPRTFMKAENGHTLPTRLVVENRRRGTITEVTYRDLAVNPVIDDRVFSIRTLEQKGRIPNSQ